MAARKVVRESRRRIGSVVAELKCENAGCAQKFPGRQQPTAAERLVWGAEKQGRSALNAPLRFGRSASKSLAQLAKRWHGLAIAASRHALGDG